MPNFYEFFAGGGMARAGLGPGWSCIFANDFDFKKAVCYRANWGGDTLKVQDVSLLTPDDLPGQADLAWASFPCQDLSLAGGGAGLKGDRSGTFWPFWELMKALRRAGRAPRVIALENVPGTLTSHGGKDFAAISAAIAQDGYRFGAMIVDAALFVPQSRPRLFVIAVREDIELPAELLSDGACASWTTAALRLAYSRLDRASKAKWVWWSMPEPPLRNSTFADLIEEPPFGVEWHTDAETAKHLGMMSHINSKKVEAASIAKRLMVGGIYKRTRRDENGEKVQRAEIRFDDVAGCLRTPAGGSSRQVIMIVKGKKVRSRLISPRETARLMGLPDDYVLPTNYNEAYHLTGDGVVVPVVRHLAAHLLEPLLHAGSIEPRVAA
jgi:DNA (cytosine-5)-methyltransferase 1